MSVPADQMDARRRIPVARPAVQQLALPAPPAPPPAPQLGTPATTVVPPSGDTIAVDRAGRASVSNIQPRTPATAAAQLGGRPGTIYVTPEGTASNNVFEARSAAVRERMAAGRPPPTAAPLTTPGPTPATAAAQLRGAPAAAPVASGAGQEISAARRLGQVARPVAQVAEKVLAPIRPIANAVGKSGVLGGLATAVKTAGTTTPEFADRFGVDNPTSLVGDLAVRAAGAATEGAALLPDLAIGAGNLIGRGVKAAFPNAPDWLTAQAPTMSDLYDNSAMRTRIQREAAANDGVVPAGIALAMGPNGELPKALPEVTTPTAQQQLAGARPAPATTANPPQSKPQSQQPQAADSPATAQSDVVGEINGRKITRAESDRLSKQNVVPGYTGNAAEQLRGPRDTGPRVFMPKGDDRATIEKIDKAISDLGPLDRRGKRQALVDLLGLRQRGVASDLDRGSLDGRSAAEIAQRDAASQLGADVDREQIAATAANARRQNTQTIADAKGNVYAVEGTTLAPLTTPSGEQLRGAVATSKQDTGLQDAAMKLIEQSAAAGVPLDPNAAVAAVRQVQAAMAAPPGMIPAGTSPDGKPIYKDAQGRTFTDDGQ